MENYKWYALKIRTNSEKTVIRSLIKKIKQENMQKKVDKIFFPEGETRSKKTGKKSHTNFYPGYLFVKMLLDDQTIDLVKSTRNVFGFVGVRSGEQKPIPVKDDEVEAIIQQVKDGSMKKITKKVYSEEDQIQVISGSFAGFNGTIKEVNHERKKVKAFVSIFGRPTLIELEYDQIKKISK